MSITEMKKAIQHLAEEVNDEALLQEALEVLKQAENDGDSNDWEDLPEEERNEMLAAIERAEKGIGTISWEDYKHNNPQWFKK